MSHSHVYIVEHLDPELETWQSLEYQCIARESKLSNNSFLLSGLSKAHLPQTQQQLKLEAANLSDRSVEAIYPDVESRKKICLLDPKASQDLRPEDGEAFEGWLFGGILGDDPPRDRTSELRDLGFATRRLGSEQMTTDTAVRVTRLVTQDKVPLDKVPYIDRPEIKLPGHEGESIEMPFRYVQGKDGEAVMPEGMTELLAMDADKGILDLL